MHDSRQGHTSMASGRRPIECVGCTEPLTHVFRLYNHTRRLVFRITTLYNVNTDKVYFTSSVNTYLPWCFVGWSRIWKLRSVLRYGGRREPRLWRYEVTSQLDLHLHHCWLPFQLIKITSSITVIYSCVNSF